MNDLARLKLVTATPKLFSVTTSRTLCRTSILSRNPKPPYVLYEPAACIRGTIEAQQVLFLVDSGSCITMDRLFLKGVSHAPITQGAFNRQGQPMGKSCPYMASSN